MPKTLTFNTALLSFGGNYLLKQIKYYDIKKKCYWKTVEFKTIKTKNITTTCMIWCSSVVTKISTHWSSSVSTLVTSPITSLHLKLNFNRIQYNYYYFLSLMRIPPLPQPLWLAWLPQTLFQPWWPPWAQPSPPLL